MADEIVDILDETEDTVEVLEEGVTLAAGQATVQLNGTTVGTIASGGADSFSVVQDGSPVGSWNGTEWIVPPSPPPSLSVALSASNIEYGQDLTITATPTGLTPTNYFAFTKCALNSMTYIGEQAGNVFVWTVNSSTGANTIYVVADDGTASVINIGGDAVTVTSNYLLNYTTFLACWSTIKRGQTFNDPILRALRSSDSDEADFTPVTGVPEVFDGLSIASNSVPATHDGDTFSTFISTDNGSAPNWYDQTGNSHDAGQYTLSNQPTLATSGVIENVGGTPAFSFDGTDYFSIWNSTTAPAAWQGLSGEITLLFRCAPSNVGSAAGAAYFSAETVVEMRQNIASVSNVPFNIGFGNGKIQVGVSTSGVTTFDLLESSASLTNGVEVAVAVVFNSDNVSIYIDGELDSEHTIVNATGDRSIGSANSTLSIGARSRDGGQIDRNQLQGGLIELQVIPSSLTASDVLNIYNFYQS